MVGGPFGEAGKGTDHGTFFSLSDDMACENKWDRVRATCQGHGARVDSQYSISAVPRQLTPVTAVSPAWGRTDVGTPSGRGHPPKRQPPYGPGPA